MSAIKRIFCCCVPGGSGITGLKRVIKPGKKCQSDTQDVDGKPDVVTSHESAQTTPHVTIPPVTTPSATEAVNKASESPGSYKSELVFNVGPQRESTRSVSTTSMNGSQADALLEVPADDTQPAAEVEEEIVVIKSARKSESRDPESRHSDVTSDGGEAGREDKTSEQDEVATAGLTLSVELKKPEPLILSDTPSTSVQEANFKRRTSTGKSGRSLFVLRHSNTPSNTPETVTSPQTPDSTHVDKVLLVKSTEQSGDE